MVIDDSLEEPLDLLKMFPDISSAKMLDIEILEPTKLVEFQQHRFGAYMINVWGGIST